jgi:hypothetical protein
MTDEPEDRKKNPRISLDEIARWSSETSDAAGKRKVFADEIDRTAGEWKSVVAGQYGKFLIDTEVFLSANRNRITSAQLNKLRKRLILMRDKDQEIFRFESLDKPVPPAPPAAAEFLFAFLGPKAHAETMIGDLAELFASDCLERGHQRARLLYWSRTLRSMLPLVIAKLRTWGVIAAVIGYGRSKIGW